MDRLQKIKLAIQKGITCNPETGEVFGVKGDKLLSKPSSTYSKITLKQGGKSYQLRFHIFIESSPDDERSSPVGKTNKNVSEPV